MCKMKTSILGLLVLITMLDLGQALLSKYYPKLGEHQICDFNRLGIECQNFSKLAVDIYRPPGYCEGNTCIRCNGFVAPYVCMDYYDFCIPLKDTNFQELRQCSISYRNPSYQCYSNGDFCDPEKTELVNGDANFCKTHNCTAEASCYCMYEFNTNVALLFMHPKIVIKNPSVIRYSLCKDNSEEDPIKRREIARFRFNDFVETYQKMRACHFDAIENLYPIDALSCLDRPGINVDNATPYKLFKGGLKIGEAINGQELCNKL